MIVGVIPAAGRATRLAPLPHSKEVIEVDGRAVLEHLAERMRAARAEEIRVVTRPEKTDVAGLAAGLGATVVEANPEHVSASILAGTAGLAGDDIVLFGFPDTIWEPVDGFAPLVALVEAGEDLALGLFRGNELERCDVAVLDGRGRVEAVDVKPDVPRSEWLWGCGAARASLLCRMGEDAEPGVYFDRLAREGTIAAVQLSDVFIDIGTPASLAALRAEGRA